MPLLDVSLPLDASLPIWPANPPFDLTPVKRITDGASSNVSRLTLGTHTGTHIDAPRHMIEGAPTLDQLPLDALVGPGRVVAIETDRAIEARHVDGDALQGSTRILFKTRNSTFWGSPEFRTDFVFLSEEAARALRAQRRYRGPLNELPRFSAALFKGVKRAGTSAVVHRSPPVASCGKTRLFLCLNEEANDD